MRLLRWDKAPRDCRMLTASLRSLAPFGRCFLRTRPHTNPAALPRLRVIPDKRILRRPFSSPFGGDGALSSAGPSLLQGFNGELPKGLVHSLRSLIDVGDDHSDGLPNGGFLGGAYSEAR